MDWNGFIKNYQGNPDEHIAIIGLAGRFPGASTIEEFWDNLKEGRESITYFTREQLLKANLDRRILDDPRYSGADGIIEDMDMFDAEFFGFSPREAEMTDPQHRLFLECAWELMEKSGYDSEHYTGQVGVFASANLSTYLIRNLMANPEFRSQATSFQTVLGNDKDFIATRTSYKLNLTGPSVNVATLCSSSAVAIHLACQSLLTFQCDMALAGAVSLQASRNESFFYQEGGIGSPDGHCRAFDSKANGTVSGSGIGIVSLKRLEDAVREGDNILAVIRGTAVNNDGAGKISFTAPGMQKQVEAVTQALNLADVDPETITYVEAHGMGTPLGDPIEIEALTKAYRKYTGKNAYCAIGSVKTNIGHLVNAGGVAGLIKTVLAMQHKQIPASLNYENPNPMIQFDKTPFYVNTGLSRWEAGTNPRRAGVNSFGIGGTNVHMVLEEAPDFGISGPSRQWQLISLSGRDEKALNRLSANLKSFMKDNPTVNAADLAYTLHVGRRTFPHRMFFVCRSLYEAVEILDNQNSDRIYKRFRDGQDTSVAFVFPGELSTVPTSFVRELYQHEPVFSKNMDKCAEIFQSLINLDLWQVLDAEPDILKSGYTAQAHRAAVFSTQYALAGLWMEWGIMPQAVFGLDLVGECLAACTEGKLSLEDATAAVVSGQMGSLKGLNDLDNIIEDSQFVFLEIGGEKAALDTINKKCNSDAVFSSFGCSAPKICDSSTAAILTTLGSLWLAGVKLDWNGFHINEQRHRLPLPTYPFDRKRFWVEPEPQNGEGTRSTNGLTYHERPSLSSPYTAARNETEARLVEIWQDLMGIRPIGVLDSFIQLGGHSLLAAQIMSRARDAFNIEIPMNTIFEEPTVANIAKYIDTVKWASQNSEAAAAGENREEGEL